MAGDGCRRMGAFKVISLSSWPPSALPGGCEEPGRHSLVSPLCGQGLITSLPWARLWGPPSILFACTVWVMDILEGP